MQRRTFLAVCAAVSVPSLLTACGKTMPISPAGAISGLTLDEVRDCIYQAARGRQWVVRSVNENLVEATFVKGPHVAVVDVAFDEEMFRIMLSPKTSKTLLNSDGTVHRKINQWIANLEKDINTAMLKRKIGRTSAEPATP